MKLLYIAGFGVCGVLSRYFAGTLATRFLPPPFPYGTLLVNLSGAFLVGIIYVMGIERAVISPELRAGIMIGFLGGFTTFSSYCLETVHLFEEGEYWHSIFYFGLSPMLGLAAAVAGIFLARFVMANLAP